LRACERELTELEKNEQDKLRMLDVWNFQRKEIEALSPAVGEDAELEQERRVLQNLSKLQDAAGAAYECLYDSSQSALAQLRTALRRVDELRRIDASLDPLAATLQPAEIAVEEASLVVRDYLARLEADPSRLDALETRLADIERLKRKYGATIEEVLAFLEDLLHRISQIEHADEHRAALAKHRENLAKEYQLAAAALTAARTEAARSLQKKVEAELASLAMERTVFRIQLSPDPWSERGVDRVLFLVSPNPGEEPKPLEKIASGGEISRIALALKTALTIKASGGKRAGSSASPAAAADGAAAAGVPRTLVFDEVDAGVGGKAAETLGRRLKALAGGHQVLCVTHLPQIASFADHHFYVEKKQSKGRTIATMVELDSGARVQELARMLSGEQLTPEVLKHAQQMIAMNS
jgi:DNA repair protein RecN (Recombination protein N)